MSKNYAELILVSMVIGAWLLKECFKLKDSLPGRFYSIWMDKFLKEIETLVAIYFCVVNGSKKSKFNVLLRRLHIYSGCFLTGYKVTILPTVFISNQILIY